MLRSLADRWETVIVAHTDGQKQQQKKTLT